jgi:hypothetical protein
MDARTEIIFQGGPLDRVRTKAAADDRQYIANHGVYLETGKDPVTKLRVFTFQGTPVEAPC